MPEIIERKELEDLQQEERAKLDGSEEGGMVHEWKRSADGSG